jgi:hypothetical protein
VNNFRNCLILISLFFLSISGGFTASGQERTGGNIIESTASGRENIEDIKPPKEPKKDIKSLIKTIEKEKEKEKEKDETETDVGEINKAIIQLYKIQWNKVLKELDQSFQKFYEDDETRLQAYKQIQSTYVALKKKSQNTEMSENNKKILWAYLDYMISMLEKKIQELTE